MTNARQRILTAVRTALGGSPPDARTVAADAAALLSSPGTVRPRLPDASLADIFAARLAQPRMGATVERLDRLAEWPAAVRRYLAAQGLPPAAALQPAPELTALDWTGTEIHATAAPNEAAGVGLARWGIAENGSLVFHSGADAPILLNFLPLHHIVAVRTRDLLAYTEDYAAAAAVIPTPRNAVIITGASGTTDIEGSYQRGAHGPAFLHVAIVG